MMQEGSAEQPDEDEAKQSSQNSPGQKQSASGNKKRNED